MVQQLVFIVSFFVAFFQQQRAYVLVIFMFVYFNTFFEVMVYGLALFWFFELLKKGDFKRAFELLNFLRFFTIFIRFFGI